MDPRRVGRYMTLQRSDQEFIAKWTGDVRQPGNPQRLDPVDIERIDILGVIGIGESGAQAGAHPIVLFTKRYFVIEDMVRGIEFHPAHGSGGREVSRRNGRLVEREARAGVDIRDGIVRRKGLCQCRRVPDGGGSVLKLPSCVERKAAGDGVGAGSRVVVEPVCVRPPVIVDDGRAHVKTIAQRSAGHDPRKRINRLDARVSFQCQARTGHLVA